MKIRIPRGFAAVRLALLLAVLSPCGAQAAAAPAAKLDFEQDKVGQVPEGWKVTPDAAANYDVRITDEKPEGGRLCAVLASTGAPASQGFGWALRSFDAAPYQGKRVRFRAAVRSELGPTGQRARLILASGKAAAGIFAATSAPITSGQWASYEAAGRPNRLTDH